MTFREMTVTENPDGTKVVNFWPGMYVRPAYEKEPTKNDPNIKADLGSVGGKMSPLKAYYPDYVDTDNIVKPEMFDKVDHCPMCERKKREIVQRLRSAMERGRGREDSVRKMVEESNRIKAELKSDGYELANAADHQDDGIPDPLPPFVPPMVERSLQGREAEIAESEKIYKSTTESVSKAISSVQDTIMRILRGPSEIKLPTISQSAKL
jgi:hypothetical protein